MARDFSALYRKAHAAGMAAGAAAIPTPMVVTGTSGRTNETKSYFVSEGLCGFAWINVKGSTAFGKWAKAAGVARPGYPSGLSFWVGEFNQSITRKEAYAHAFAKVLSDAGITAYTGSRLD